MPLALRMRVYLHDEAPRIGCGWRIVSVVVGRQWVRLAASAGRAKVTKAMWAQIARHGHELPERKRRARKMRKEAEPVYSFIAPPSPGSVSVWKELAQRKADAPIKPKKPQNHVMDAGLWSDDAKQKELF